jgi:hypothetical protein
MGCVERLHRWQHGAEPGFRQGLRVVLLSQSWTWAFSACRYPSHSSWDHQRGSLRQRLCLPGPPPTPSTLQLMLLVTSGMFQILCPVYFTAVTNGIQSSNIGYTSHKVFAFAFPPVAQQDHGEYFSKNTHPYKPPPSFVASASRASTLIITDLSRKERLPAFILSWAFWTISAFLGRDRVSDRGSTRLPNLNRLGDRSSL